MQGTRVQSLFQEDPTGRGEYIHSPPTPYDIYSLEHTFGSSLTIYRQWEGGGGGQREAKGHDIDLGVILYGFELKLGLWNRKVWIETENTLKTGLHSRLPRGVRPRLEG